jgi:hypothetical protein
MARDRGGIVPPPLDLAKRTLHLRELGPARWSRIHRSGLGPCYYSDDPGNRFSSSGFGVLYLADAPGTAFWEIFWDELGTRPENERRIGRAKLNQRVLRDARVQRPLQIFDATSARNLKAVSAPTATFSGDYANCQSWARALYAHPVRPDGIVFSSARHGGGLCLALFAHRTECADLEFGAATIIGDSLEILISMLENKVNVLDDP